MNNNPVIVYRSQSEQLRDEYLFGEGFFSPSGITDIGIVCLGFGLIVVCVSLFSRRGRK